MIYQSLILARNMALNITGRLLLQMYSNNGMELSFW